jgi:N-acetylneuraminic acid mutarotase
MVIDGKVYVSGGFSRRWDAAAGKWRLETLGTLYVYDPAVDRWTRKRDIPVTSAKGVSAVYHGKLHVPAGYPDALFRYDPTTDRWVRLTDVPYG